MKRTLSILIFLVVLLLSSCKIKSQAEIDAEKYVYENATIEHFLDLGVNSSHLRIYKYPDLTIIDEEDKVYIYFTGIKYIQIECPNEQIKSLEDYYHVSHNYGGDSGISIDFRFKDNIIEVLSYVDGHFWFKTYSRYYKITENDCNTLIALIEEIGNQ